MDVQANALLELLAELARSGYQFTTVTPETHALVLRREPGNRARRLRDVLGWGLPFPSGILPPHLFELLRAAGGCELIATDVWRPTLRVSSLGELLFVHSRFPTFDQDAVFFGPDSYRFVRALRQLAPHAARVVDVGCGCGVGGIALQRFRADIAQVVLADINPRALRYAAINAQHANVPAEIVQSDVLSAVTGKVDLIISNPPYLVDPDARQYRHGGGKYGEQLSVRICRESLERLRRDGGGSLLLYTGVAIVDGENPFLGALRDELEASDCSYVYEEIDPDIFASELRHGAYAHAERIAAALLRVDVAGAD